MSSPADAFHEARERHESAGEHSPRWVPLAAAILAVLAAIAGFLGNLRSTAALFEKNEAAVATTHAADAWNEYEARSIKQNVYNAALLQAGAGDSATIRSRAAHEREAAGPAMAKAKAFEEEATRHNERSERLLQGHEILEVGVTLFEIAIVLVSITALVGSRLLLPVSLVAAGIGVVFTLVGALR